MHERLVVSGGPEGRRRTTSRLPLISNGAMPQG